MSDYFDFVQCYISVFGMLYFRNFEKCSSSLLILLYIFYKHLIFLKFAKIQEFIKQQVICLFYKNVLKVILMHINLYE